MRVDDARAVVAPDRGPTAAGRQTCGRPCLQIVEPEVRRLIVAAPGGDNDVAAVGREPRVFQGALRLSHRALGSVGGHDDQFVGVCGRHVSEYAAAGHCVMAPAAAARQLHRHAFQERYRGLRRRILRVEGRCEQRRSAAEHHVPVRVTRRGPRQQLLDRAGLPIVRVNVPGEFEQHGPSIRQNLGLTTRGRSRQRLDASALRWHHVQVRVRAVGEHDAAVGPPARARRKAHCLGDIGRRAAVDGNALQPAIGKKPDPIAVPGEERAGSPFGTGQWRRLEAIERSAIQPLPVLVTGRDHNHPTVGRDGDRRRVPWAAGHAHAVRQHGREPNRYGWRRRALCPWQGLSPEEREQDSGKNPCSDCGRAQERQPRSRRRKAGRPQQEPVIADVAQPFAGIPLQTGAQQRPHAQRDTLPPRLRGEHRRQRLVQRLTSKGAVGGDHLVEDGAERPHVHPRVHARPSPVRERYRRACRTPRRAR